MKSTTNFSLSGNCRELTFPSFYFFADKRLVKHKIRAEQVPDMDVCELLCYHEHNCVSFNFENQANDAGTYKCELNNSTHREHDNHFKDKKGFFYRGTEVRITHRI